MDIFYKDFINVLSEGLELWKKDEDNTKYVDFFNTRSAKLENLIELLKTIMDDNEERIIIHSFLNTIEYYLRYKNIEDYNLYYTFNEYFNKCLVGKMESKSSVFDNNLNHLKILKDFTKCLFAFAIIDTKASNGVFLQKKILVENDFDKIMVEQKNNFCYFRGQSNYNWGIIPSIFRNHIFRCRKKSDGDYVDLHLLYEKYEESDLIQKYNDTIAKDTISSYNDLSLDFIAYMQHSLAYSPLIDITTKMEISSQFALGNKEQVNSFLGEDSIIFSFEVLNLNNHLISGDNENELKNINFNVKILNKKIIPGTIMQVEDTSGKTHNLDFTTLRSTIINLRPKFKIIDKVYNDRMRYQHGRFILFYDYTIFNDRILFHLNPDLNIITYKLEKKHKKSLYKLINKLYPQYNMDYLMAPYDYFKK